MQDKDQLLKSLADILVAEMRSQLRLAGHVMTGSLSESVEERINNTITGASIEIWLNNYGIALDQGVPPERIPFTEPSGRGGRSLYIEGLQRFAQLKLGVTDQRESLGIAFAIARKQKEKGMPIAGATEFIQKTINATQADVAEFIENWAAAIFEAQIDLIIQNVRA
jgi:hypothetical protein